MDITTLINLIVQNWFLVVFSSTVLFFMIRVGNAMIDKYFNKSNKLEDSIVLNLVRSTVWYHSRWKLRHIESILIENNIEKRKEEITRKIRNALEERTAVYISYFNTLNTNIQRLWDFYAKVFEMEPFFEDVMKVVLRKYESDNHIPEIAIKLKDISEIMYEAQDRANIKLDDELNRLSWVK